MAYRNTKPCHNVVKVGDTYTTCTRDECTYAHSLEELTPVQCMYNNRCMKFPICPYKHPRETLEEYFRRIGQSVPDLPQKSLVPKKVSIVIPEIKSKVSINDFLGKSYLSDFLVIEKSKK